jgi:hypothetical protein
VVHAKTPSVFVLLPVRACANISSVVGRCFFVRCLRTTVADRLCSIRFHCGESRIASIRCSHPRPEVTESRKRVHAYLFVYICVHYVSLSCFRDEPNYTHQHSSLLLALASVLKDHSTVCLEGLKSETSQNASSNWQQLYHQSDSAETSSVVVLVCQKVNFR